MSLCCQKVRERNSTSFSVIIRNTQHLHTGKRETEREQSIPKPDQKPIAFFSTQATYSNSYTLKHIYALHLPFLWSFFKRKKIVYLVVCLNIMSHPRKREEMSHVNFVNLSCEYYFLCLSIWHKSSTKNYIFLGLRQFIL